MQYTQHLQYLLYERVCLLFSYLACAFTVQAQVIFWSVRKNALYRPIHGCSVTVCKADMQVQLSHGSHKLYSGQRCPVAKREEGGALLYLYHVGPTSKKPTIPLFSPPRLTGMPKEKYDPPDPRRLYTIMSAEEAANGKKSYWAELEITGWFTSHFLFLRLIMKPIHLLAHLRNIKVDHFFIGRS